MSTVLEAPHVEPRVSGRSGKVPRRVLTLSLLLAAGVWAGVATGVLPRSLLAGRLSLAAFGGGYAYHVIGDPDDVARPTRAGFVLQGGGTDIDDGFRWLIERSGGGDFVVLRSSGTNAYNSYIYDMTARDGARPDSVATLIVKSRAAASDPFVLDLVRNAEALWIAGGDQGRHVAVWRGTPLADAIQGLIARGAPIGGTSSGLAVFGPVVYTADADGPKAPHLTSTTVTRDPFCPRVTLRPGFLRMPFLEDAILEPHFIQESRHGRLAGFLSRADAGATRGLGIDRKTALLVEPDGTARVITHPDHPFGTATFFSGPVRPTVCEPGRPLSTVVQAVEFGRGGRVDLKAWGGEGGKPYRLAVDAGKVTIHMGQGRAAGGGLVDLRPVHSD